MAHDDDKPDAGDDPWAGLEGDGLPELDGDFSFAFDEEQAELDVAPRLGDDAADEPGPAEAALDDSDDEPEVLAFTRPTDEPPAPAVAADDAEDVFAPVADGGDGRGSETGGWASSEGDEFADTEIDAWLTDADDAAAAASSVFPFDVGNERPSDAMGAADAMASASSVEIGTGTSGIVSPSSIESQADLDGRSLAAPEADMFAFVAEPAASDEAEPEGGHMADDGDAADLFAAAGVAAAAAVGSAATAPEAKPRAVPARRKQPSVVGQLLGVVAGGALAIPVTLAILIWGFGKDPFRLTSLVPESLSFLVPEKFRPGGLGGDAIDLAGAASLDAVVGDVPPADEIPAAADLPAEPEPAVAAGLADVEPQSEPDEPDAPGEPLPADLAAADALPATAADEPADDPLMDLLNEEQAETVASAAAPVAAVAALPASPPLPVAPPEPEPLDLDDLDAALAAVAAGLEEVTAIDDIADPEQRKRLAEWYLDLAGYAQELVNLEALAAQTGRPFEPAVERAATVQTAISGHPELLEGLAALTRDWVAYAKRSSDGLVMPATFVEARRVGPYWRSQVTLPAVASRPAAAMVVLTRTEPAVAAGDSVLVTGLVVDDDVIWAADLRPTEAALEGVPGL